MSDITPQGYIYGSEPYSRHPFWNETGQTFEIFGTVGVDIGGLCRLPYALKWGTLVEVDFGNTTPHGGVWGIVGIPEGSEEKFSLSLHLQLTQPTTAYTPEPGILSVQLEFRAAAQVLFKLENGNPVFDKVYGWLAVTEKLDEDRHTSIIPFEGAAITTDLEVAEL